MRHERVVGIGCALTEKRSCAPRKDCSAALPGAEQCSAAGCPTAEVTPTLVAFLFQLLVPVHCIASLECVLLGSQQGLRVYVRPGV